MVKTRAQLTDKVTAGNPSNLSHVFLRGSSYVFRVYLLSCIGYLLLRCSFVAMLVQSVLANML